MVTDGKITAPVGLASTANFFGVASDVGTVCTASMINKWSKFKPIKLDAAGYATRTARDIAFYNAWYGLGTASKKAASYSEIFSNTAQKYTRQTPSLNQWFRLDDFEGYNHASPVPCIVQNAGNDWVVYTDSFGTGSSSGTKEVTIASLLDSACPNLTALDFGPSSINSSGVVTYTGKLYLGALITPPDWTPGSTGSKKPFMFISGVPITTSGATGAGQMPLYYQSGCWSAQGQGTYKIQYFLCTETYSRTNSLMDTTVTTKGTAPTSTDPYIYPDEVALSGIEYYYIPTDFIADSYESLSVKAAAEAKVPMCGIISVSATTVGLFVTWYLDHTVSSTVTTTISAAAGLGSEVIKTFTQQPKQSGGGFSSSWTWSELGMTVSTGDRVDVSVVTQTEMGGESELGQGYSGKVTVDGPTISV